MKPSLKSEWLPLLLLAASWVIAVYFYRHFPALVATHWDSSGRVNGYMGRTGGAFFLPVLLSGMYALFLVLPALDPRRQRYESFAPVYHVFKAAILGILLLLFIASGMYNLGYAVNIATITPLLIGLLFIILGNYMGKIKRNWFIGIRTPWTMSSEDVWNKTHRMGGYLMVACGLLMLAVPLVPGKAGFLLVMGAVLTFALATTAYSYLVYRQIPKT